MVLIRLLQDIEASQNTLPQIEWEIVGLTVMPTILAGELQVIFEEKYF